MNQDAANDEEMTVTLTLDDGTDLECVVLTIFEAADKEYIALLPLDGNEAEDGEVYLYRYTEDADGNPDIQNIESDEKVQKFLEAHGSTTLKSGSTLAELIKRPELNYEMLAELDEKRPELPADVREQVDINLKYDGYIRRQKQQVAQFKKLEGRKIPANLDYTTVNSLRREAVQKLNLYKPENIGQASRISGVSPADISVLMVHLEQMGRK